MIQSAAVGTSKLPPRVRLIAGALVFSIALALRVGYGSTFPPGAVLESVDARGYHQIALNLLTGHGFSLQAGPPYRPDAVRTPLYPAFVAFVYAVAGPHPEAVALVQAILDSVTALLAGAFAARIAGTRAGFVAAIAYAVMPGQVRMTNALLTETLLAFCLALATLALGRVAPAGSGTHRSDAPALACGLALGLAVLCKPNVLILPALYGIGGAWLVHGVGARRHSLRVALLVTGGALLLILPWVARNWLVFQRPMLSTAFQDNLVRVTAPATLAAARGEYVAPWTPRWEALSAEIVNEAAARHGWPEGDPEQLGSRAYEARQAQAASVALEVVMAHPQAAVLSHLAGFARSWVPTEYQFWYEYFSGEPWAEVTATPDALGRALTLLRQGDPGAALALVVEARWHRLPVLARWLWLGWGLAYLVAGLLAGRGAILLARRSPALAFVLLATILVVTLLPGPIAYVRFRMPVVPLIVALEALGLSRETILVRTGRGGREVGALPVKLRTPHRGVQ